MVKALIGPCLAENSCLISEVTKQEVKKSGNKFGSGRPILLHWLKASWGKKLWIYFFNSYLFGVQCDNIGNWVLKIYIIFVILLLFFLVTNIFSCDETF